MSLKALPGSSPGGRGGSGAQSRSDGGIGWGTSTIRVTGIVSRGDGGLEHAINGVQQAARHSTAIDSRRMGDLPFGLSEDGGAALGIGVRGGLGRGGAVVVGFELGEFGEILLVGPMKRRDRRLVGGIGRACGVALRGELLTAQETEPEKGEDEQDGERFFDKAADDGHGFLFL